jgi:preprotein translocase subunit SecB
MLDPVDFVALYRRELARRAEEQGNGAAAPANAPANS